MKLVTTGLEGLFVIEPRVFEDSRGYFFESYNKAAFEKEGHTVEFVQDNQSKSSFGVVRGLHYQLYPYAQTKLVRILEGRVLDIAVDLRKGSPSYKKWFGIELSAENKIQLLIPKGFAHGFSVLSKSAVFFYKCDELYNPESERGICYNDPSLNINWGSTEKDIIVSLKVREMPDFNNVDINFTY